METLPELLRRGLQAHRWSTRSFAERAGIRVSQAYVAQVARGLTPLAEDRINGWAKELFMALDDRRVFMQAAREALLRAHIAQAPKDVQAYIEQLERETGRRPQMEV